MARRRAAQGVPLELSLLGYEIGSQVLLAQVVAHLPSTAQAAPILAEASRRILDHVHLATSAVAVGYQDASAAGAVEDERRVQRYLEALAGRSRDPGAEAMLLPAEVTTPLRWCAVSAALGGDHGNVVERGRRRCSDALVGRLEDRLVVLAAAPRDLSWLSVPMGTADVADRVPVALRRATAAADVAAHLGLAVAPFGQVGALAGLLSVPDADREEFLRCRLGPLRDTAHVELLETLRVYLEHGLSTSAAARVLHVHRHTLEYRLQRIRDIGGPDARDPHQRFLLDAALFLLPSPTR